jgi:hypothetical protein
MFSELLSDWIDSAGVFEVGLDVEVRGAWIPVVSRIRRGAERFAQAGVIEPLFTSTIWAPGR